MHPQNYQVIILAAGTGRRLQHITKDIPKSFLKIHGKPILEYTLDHLAEQNLTSIIIVVGYLGDLIIQKYGKQYKSLKIQYVYSDDFAATGSGWSIFQTKLSWLLNPTDVLIIHADIFYDPSILEAVLFSTYPNLVAVGDRFKKKSQDEILVLGKIAQVSSIKTARDVTEPELGELIGIMKWSREWMSLTFDYMEDFFSKNGPNYNWEPVIDKMLQEKIMDPIKLHSLDCKNLAWININYEEDLERARTLIYEKVNAR